MFGYDMSDYPVEQFRTKFKSVETQIKNGEFRSYGYSGAFLKPPLLGYYIKATPHKVHKLEIKHD